MIGLEKKKNEVVLSFKGLRYKGNHTMYADLMNQAQGGTCCPGNGKWEFSAQEQLSAIEELGKTGDAEALDFLANFAEWRLCEEMTEHCLGGSVGTGRYTLKFPNARGLLRSLLEADWNLLRDCDKALITDVDDAKEDCGWLPPKSIHEFRIFSKDCDDMADDSRKTFTAKIRRLVDKLGLENFEKRYSVHLLGDNVAYLLLIAAIRRLEALVIVDYKYTAYNVDDYPCMFDDAYRFPSGEVGSVEYAILHPYQQYDDDTVLVRWDSKSRKWTMSFSLGLGGGDFPDGEDIRPHGNKTENERAGLVLLAHFGLMHKRNDLSPSLLACMGPDELAVATKPTT